MTPNDTMSKVHVAATELYRSCCRRIQVQRVSKNVPPLTCYNLDMHGSITIIFGKSVTEKVGNQSVLYFPTSPNLCFCTACGNRKPDNCIFSLKCCMLFTKNTRNTLIKISPDYSWTTLHCQNDRLDAPDRT